ncbi:MULTISPECIES: histone-like nucleoid-structuring protein Lsr2 [unclassified Rhodococcus (in: high G+C Gram-positive bacteria)]|uniref:histone-like nucleoid-structuring protein Lsr2 n=1 Tax=unclassified Rhodococcus (in: high G+C Gram-positive bacteria) TaxID=192944 RepID=UPI0019CF94E6|nr:MULTISPECIES: Lsr2 family protein [unclassified Rhodococcus (in: high G+C Gram-positive bacteria)]MDV8056432.1 Lsr2 family protein [Rhodococcus sp. IEGM 1343]
MVRKVSVELFDDIDGSTIESGAGETIDFSVNGIDYVIDLKTMNANDFHRTLDYFIEHATRVGGRPRQTSASISSSTPTTTRGGSSQPKIVRQWAADKGYTISYTGRIPTNIQQAYDAAH